MGAFAIGSVHPSRRRAYRLVVATGAIAMTDMTQAEVDAARRVAEKVHAQAPNANPQAAFLARAVLHLAARQMPELRWEDGPDGDKLCFLGPFHVGAIIPYMTGGWRGYLVFGLAFDGADTGYQKTEPEARAAVEAAVRKELGMSP